MNLPFEGAEAVLDYDVLQGLPAALLGETPPRTDSISRLLFESLDAVRQDETAWAAPVSNTEALDALQQENAILKVQLQRQSLETCDELERVKRGTRAEARAEWEAELDERLTVERELVRQTCERFREERERYFHAVEGEVVRLSLAIAQRVLHREAAMDPLLLAAVVRVALEKMREGSGMVLRVPAGDEGPWRKSSVVTSSEVTLIADEGMTTGDCVLETSMERVELGVSAQLAEIERGFFDLLQRRPA